MNNVSESKNLIQVSIEDLEKVGKEIINVSNDADLANELLTLTNKRIEALIALNAYGKHFDAINILEHLDSGFYVEKSENKNRLLRYVEFGKKIIKNDCTKLFDSAYKLSKRITDELSIRSNQAPYVLSLGIMDGTIPCEGLKDKLCFKNDITYDYAYEYYLVDSSEYYYVSGTVYLLFSNDKKCQR